MALVERVEERDQRLLLGRAHHVGEAAEPVAVGVERRQPAEDAVDPRPGERVVLGVHLARHAEQLQEDGAERPGAILARGAVEERRVVRGVEQGPERVQHRLRVGLEEAEVGHEQVLVGARQRLVRDDRQRARDDGDVVARERARSVADLGAGAEVDDGAQAHAAHEQLYVVLGQPGGELAAEQAPSSRPAAVRRGQVAEIANVVGSGERDEAVAVLGHRSGAVYSSPYGW